MTQEYNHEAQTLATLLWRVGAEVAAWGAASSRLEGLTADLAPALASPELQNIDAMTQHLSEVSAFLLRLSEDLRLRGGITESRVEDLAGTVCLSGLQGRLLGRLATPHLPENADPELW